MGSLPEGAVYHLIGKGDRPYGHCDCIGAGTLPGHLGQRLSVASLNQGLIEHGRHFRAGGVSL